MTQYLCKNCVHSRINLFDKFGSYVFTWSEPASHWYKCAKSYKSSSVVEDPVIGSTKVKGQMDFCSVERMPGTNRCGPNAKHWSPKHKKDFFKLLTKDHHA